MILPNTPANTKRTWLQQVESTMGLSKPIVDFLGINPSDDGKWLIYPCAYPPKIDHYSQEVIYNKVERRRLLPDELLKNPDAQRFSNTPKENAPGGELPLFYTPNYIATRQAIELENGLCNAYEGDKDTWTAIQAGWHNSIGIWSAGAKIDDQLITQLKELGVKHLRYFPDADHDGWNVAERLRENCIKFGLSISIHHLPLFVNGKNIKDTSDIWLALQCNPEMYQKRLSELQQIKVLSAEDKDESSNRSSWLDPKIFTDIETKLDISEFKTNGWSKPIPCIFEKHEHDDKAPHAGWNKTMHIFRCFKCGQTASVKQTAELLGLNWQSYVRKQHTPTPGNLASNGSAVKSSAADLRVSNSSLQSFMDKAGASNYANVPASEFMYSLDAAIDDYQQRIMGLKTSPFPPIPNPMKMLHQFGGMGRVLSRPILCGMVGVSGGFKCVHENTRIQTGQGFIKIKDLAIGQHGFSELNIDILTPSGKAVATHFYDTGIAKTKEIKTRFGYSLTATYNHPVLTLDKNGCLIWKRLDEIQIGDYAAINRTTNLFGSNINLPDCPKDHLINRLKSNGESMRMKFKQLNLPKELDVETAYILGLLIGDGGFTQKTTISFTTADKELLNALQTWLSRFGLSAKHRSRYDYVVSSSTLRQWLREIGIDGYSYEKTIPECIWNAPREQVKAFLQGIFDTDGAAAYKDKYKVYLSSSSKELANGIHLLLLQFGVIARLHFVANKTKGDWRVEIRGIDAKKFFDNIGFRLSRKQEILNHAPKKFNTNIDLAPYLPNVDISKLPGNRDNRGRLRRLLQNYNRGSKRLSYNMLQEYGDIYTEFHEILSNHYFFDEIKSIDNSLDVHCYDVTVPSEHCFISNGFVSHNTSNLAGITSQLLSEGYNGIVYSPEWSPERNADRIIQQFGGLRMDEVSLLERWHYEQKAIQAGKLKLDDGAVFGVKPDDAKMQETFQIINRMRRLLRGKLSYINNFGGNILEVLAFIKETARRMTESGAPPDFLIFDYVQLAQPPPSQWGHWTLQDTVTEIKKLTIELGLATWVASQSRKSDVESLNSKGQLLGATSAWGLNDNQFNLFFNLSPSNERLIADSGEIYRLVKLMLTKNSGGAAMLSEDEAIDLYVHTGRMVVLSRPDDMTSVEFRISDLDTDYQDTLQQNT